MLTFKHFMDRPSWAAAAGYDFNIIDCMSYAANWPNVASGCWELVADIPNIELRDAWWALPLTLLVFVIAIFYPLYFWVFGFAVWVKCHSHRRKYRYIKSERVRINLRNWLEDFDRKQRRKAEKGKS